MSKTTRFSINDLTNFLVSLHKKGLINNDFDFEKESKLYFNEVVFSNKARRQQFRQKNNKDNKSLLFKHDYKSIAANFKTDEEKKYFEIAYSFYKQIKINLEKSNVSTVNLDSESVQKWIDVIKKLIIKNRYNIDDFRKIFIYLRDNSYWRSKILYINDIERNFERILLENNEYGKRKSKAEVRAKNSRCNGRGASTAEIFEAARVFSEKTGE